MDVFDGSGSIDSAKLIEYITKQFPGELKTLIETKDELAKRQGAMSAVVEANQDRQAAKLMLDNATAEAAALVADTKAKNTAAKQKLADLEARSTAFDAQVQATEKQLADREQAVASGESVLAGKGVSLSKQEQNLADREAKLAIDEAALQARVKAFQDKVASISV